MRISLPLTLLFLLAGATASPAQLIFLKDGFVLNGKVKKEDVAVVDTVSGETFRYPKFYLVDDGPRRFYFAPTQMQRIDEAFVRAEDTVRSPRIWSILPAKGHPGAILNIVQTTAFDEKWDRTLRFDALRGGQWTLPQHLAVLNSHYAEVHSTKIIPLYSFYLTQELGPDTVRKLLVEHPDFHDVPALPQANRLERRFRLHHFLVHAGWLSHASEELDRIARDFPAAQMRVEGARDKLRKLVLQRHFDDLQRAQRTGRHKYLREQLGYFDEKHASPKMLDDFRSIKTASESMVSKMNEIKELLDGLLKRAEKAPEQALFSEAIEAIKAELYPEALGRLDLFVEQAKTAAKQVKTKGKSELSESELLSFAVSGWLLGNAAAEAKVETAKRLWRGRKLALEYCNAGVAARGLVLNRVDSRDLPSVDEMLLLLPTLPPIKPDEKLPEGITEQTTSNAKYRLQLPDEYHPGRSYPVLMVLHGGGEDAKTIIERFAEKAKTEGYILAAPTWNAGAGFDYSFSEAEHEVVLETLHDLRKRFHVDSDRVFLFGWGGGATMAFDVGMSHPDLFAGVLPMCGAPEWFARHYWPNAQYLPFYAVSGSVMGPASKQIRELFDKWVPHGYSVLHVQYKGRGVEWFSGEIEPMFEWMGRKRRLAPTTNLGRFGQGALGDEFVSYRATDNRFYWISSDKINPNCINRVPGWRTTLPARLQATMQPNQNEVFVSCSGFQHIAIWLARDARLDFDKPITFRVNSANGAVIIKRKMAPSLTTLLEDFAARLDRQRLFVARMDVQVR